VLEIVKPEVTFGVALAIVVPVYLARFGLVRLAGRRATNRRDAAIMTAMVPKGLAAAVLATLPVQAGLPGAEWVTAVVYPVVLLSIVTTAALVLALEKTRLRAVYFRAFGGFAPRPPPQPFPETEGTPQMLPEEPEAPQAAGSQPAAPPPGP